MPSACPKSKNETNIHVVCNPEIPLNSEVTHSHIPASEKPRRKRTRKKRVRGQRQQSIFHKRKVSSQHHPKEQVAIPSVEKECDLFLRFEKVTKTHGKKNRGLTYMLKLFMNPGCEYTASEMVMDEGSEVLYRNLFTSCGVMDDWESLRALGARLREIRVEIEAAKKKDNFTEVDLLKKEYEDIQKRLNLSLSIHGKSREQGSPLERMRKSFTNAVGRALLIVKALDEELWEYLCQYIRRGHHPCYCPPP